LEQKRKGGNGVTVYFLKRASDSPRQFGTILSSKGGLLPPSGKKKTGPGLSSVQKDEKILDHPGERGKKGGHPIIKKIRFADKKRVFRGEPV